VERTGTLILGAGLTGLSAAYHLGRQGDHDWRILEKAGRAGGLCRSLRDEDGFTFDQSIHILYSGDPYASALIQDLLGQTMQVQERRSWVFSDGVYTPYPWQANTFGLPHDVVKECLLGLIEVHLGRGAQRRPENFEDWCRVTFGEGFARHYMIPYNRKQWAVDLRRMTDRWIRDRVLTPSLDQVIDGALRRPERSYGPNSVFWYPRQGGIEALPDGLLARLEPSRIHLGNEVRSIHWKERKVEAADGRVWRYDRLVSSLPLAHLVAAMRPALPRELRDAAGRLEHNTVYAVNLGIRREDVSPYHWVYFPEDRFLLHRVSFPANFSRAMVPEGWSSVTVEVSTSPHRPVPTGKALVDRVLLDLQAAEIVRAGDETRLKSVVRLDPAYVIYNHTHGRDVERLHRSLLRHDIVACGRFGEWEYLNMDHAILSGKRAVEQERAVSATN